MKELQLRDIVKRLMQASAVKTQTALAAQLGIATQRITEAIGRGAIPETWLYKVALRSRRTVDWLKTGMGPEFLDEASAEAAAEFGRTAVAREVIEALEHLDDEEQAATRTFLKLMTRGDPKTRRHLMGQVTLLDELGATKQRMQSAARIMRYVPVLSSVAAGNWRPAQDPLPVGEGLLGQAETYLPGAHLYAVKIEGDSMAPIYEDGEILFVDPDQQVGQRDLGIFKRIEEQAVCFKQLVLVGNGRKLLHSFNPDRLRYPDIELRSGDEPKGRVIAPRRKEKRGM